MTDHDLPTRTEDEGATLDLPQGVGGIAPGQVLGERYQVLELLGRGGMGEVWHAFDLKLRVEVALKALREDLFKSQRGLEVLREEVRAAREVISPNVCRIFDLIEIDDRELVSMEFVDGATLLAVLQERGPLDLQEAQDIASQFLAGLEAIHTAGLIHRDIKPENIMLTRAGRVVVMDFGLARPKAEDDASVSGTPAYMAPEHAAGEALDARADVYSAGVVLAEMVSPDGIKDQTSRKSLWEAVRSEPSQVPDCPWAPVIKRAVARDRELRQNSAHTLIRELEDVTLRVGGADETNPYPGLAAFTEADAEFFYGREAEVEQMWRTLERPHLLAIIGPSGSGKSSFVRAGLIPAQPEGWSCVVSTPGGAPLVELAQALVPEFAGDAEAIRTLVRSDDPEAMVSAAVAWRERHQHVLLVVDQFEELFTLNPPEVQAAFADILGRLAVEHDVHVVISMRDDFLFHCQAHEPLRPVFSELTPLGPLVGGALRRALVQPASRCGYRFEDDQLVAEMLAEVEGERGTLPLLAFAVSRLWEERERREGLLTREAYQRIVGVGGALGRHAEDTLERIGEDRVPMVREIFRNLVTAQGTRAVRDLDHLLSVFDESEREAATEVLRALVDARLLTTFETHAGDEKPRRRIEIIHESLLANWPRLVRWRAQDQEGAQLRDELRQATRAWDEHGRHDDRLWTGSAYREFQVWRERYPGGLTEVEEDFAEAMTSLATRRRRRRRTVAATALVLVALVAMLFAGLWRRSVSETRRAAGAELVALGQLQLEPYPTATLAHAIASLELADSPAARRLALEALWKGPTALVATDDFAMQCPFSPDGTRLLQSRYLYEQQTEGHLSLLRADGSRRALENAHAGAPAVSLFLVTDSSHFASIGRANPGFKVGVWSAQEERLVAEAKLAEANAVRGISINSNLQRATLAVREGERVSIDTLRFDGAHDRLGTLDFEFVLNQKDRRWTSHVCLDSQAGAWLGIASGNEIYVVDIGESEMSPPRLLGRHEDRVIGVSCDPRGRYIGTADAQGEIRLWSLAEPSRFTTLQGPPDMVYLWFEADGLRLEALVIEEESEFSWVWDLSTDPPRWLRRIDRGKQTAAGVSRWDPSGKYLARGGTDLKFSVWSTEAPADAEPLVLRRGEIVQVNDLQFNPRGPWLATADLKGLTLWPLASEYPLVIREHEQPIFDVVFAPDGRWLASTASDLTVRLWPLAGQPPPRGRELGTGTNDLAVSPDGTRLLAGANSRGPALFSPGDDPPSVLEGFRGQVWAVAFSAESRLAAAVGGQFDPSERVIRVWDVASGEVIKILEVGETPIVYSLQFTDDGHLLSMSESGLLRWDIQEGTRELVYEGKIFRFVADAEGRKAIVVETEDPSDLWGHTLLLDLESGGVSRLEKFGNDVVSVALDQTGSLLVTGDSDGEVRMGPLDAGHPHLFLGHKGSIFAVDIDPLGRWIASGSDDNTIRLWPMPDLSKPPLHTLPRDELIAKLKTLTNLRVVRDPESATGWKLTHDPFPGWETVPTW